MESHGQAVQPDQTIPHIYGLSLQSAETFTRAVVGALARMDIPPLSHDSERRPQCAEAGSSIIHLTNVGVAPSR